MPEGNVIHRLASEHRNALAGAPVRVTSPQGRFSRGARSLDGRVLEEVDAFGKHLFYEFTGPAVLHVHLGLFGAFWRTEAPPPATTRAVRLRLERSDVVFDLTGPTVCELTDPQGRAALVARLGPDPLRVDADPERAWAKLRRRRTPIGQALLDQSVLAGVGNVYRAEVLFAHGIHPLTPANEVDHEVFRSMWAWLVRHMRQGVKDGRILTVDPKEIGLSRRRIRREDSTYVYRQDRCRRCQAEIRRWDLAGRWAYACEACQRAL